MLFIISSAALAAAQEPPASLKVSEPAEIARFLQSEGYQAALDTSGESPVIRSGASGWKFTVTFQNCEKGKDCDDLLLYSAWDAEAGKEPSLEKINDFNRENRFVRAYADKEKDPVLEMDVVFTDRQMSAPMFLEHLEIWRSMISKFAKHIEME